MGLHGLLTFCYVIDTDGSWNGRSVDKQPTKIMKKLKLSPCLITHQAMNEDVPALDEVKWSNLPSGRFTPSANCTSWTEVSLNIRNSQDALLVKTKNPWP
jgi:hypothetical protein